MVVWMVGDTWQKWINVSCKNAVFFNNMKKFHYWQYKKQNEGTYRNAKC